MSISYEISGGKLTVTVSDGRRTVSASEPLAAAQAKLAAAQQADAGAGAPPLLGYLHGIADAEERRCGDAKASIVVKYRSAIKYLTEYLRETQREHAPLSELDSEMMRSFDSWMKSRRLILSSRQFYLKRLAAMYRRAVKAGNVYDTKPFDGLIVGKADLEKETAERPNPLTAAHLKQLETLDLPERYEDTRRLILEMAANGSTALQTLQAIDADPQQRNLYPDLPRPLVKMTGPLNIRINNHLIALSHRLNLPSGILTLTNLRRLPNAQCTMPNAQWTATRKGKHHTELAQNAHRTLH